MRRTIHLRLVLGILVFMPFLGAAQTNVFSVNVVGYVNYAFRAGDNLFGNPLAFTNNSLSSVIQSAPEGTSVSQWNVSIHSFSQVSTFSSGIWSTDFLLNPGEGFRLSTPTTFTNTFVGAVLMPDGSPDFFEPPFPPPPAFEGTAGVYLRSCMTPMALSGDNIFTYLFGRSAANGEQIMTLDQEAQLWSTSTFFDGMWDYGEPSLRVGEAAYFNLGPAVENFSPEMIPEPSSLALAGLFCAGILWRYVIRKRLTFTNPAPATCTTLPWCDVVANARRERAVLWAPVISSDRK